MMDLRVKIKEGQGKEMMQEDKGSELHEKHYHEDHQGKKWKKKRQPHQYFSQSHEEKGEGEGEGEKGHKDISHSIRESLLSSDRAHLFMIYDEVVQMSTFKDEIELQERIEKYYKIIGETMELI